MTARTVIVLLLAAAFTGSGCYTFSGSSVPPHLKTIAIPLCDDQSGSGVPGLREELTNKLIDRFRQDNSLEVSDDRTRADAVLEGAIISLTDQAEVVAAGETVAKRRISVGVKVSFQDMKLKKTTWTKDFSRWGLYESISGTAQRQTAIDAAIDQISDDILLASVSGW